MARDFFKNLPDTTTPLTAPRMNGLLDGDEAMGNIVVDSIRGKNMFDENAILRGYELIGSGTYIGGLNPNSDWYVSDFIEVQPNQNYYLTKGSSGSSNLFYNSNKEYVDIVSASRGAITVPNNNNIKYMRFNGLLSQLSNVQFEKGTSATNYAPYQGVGYVSGQNSNGYYIKYDDGTLIQWGIIDKTKFLNPSSTSTTVQGINWYRSNNPSIVLPTSFIDTNYSVNLTVLEGISGSRFIVPETFSKTATGMTVQLIGVEDFTSSGTAYSNLYSVSYIAIGRWK